MSDSNITKLALANSLKGLMVKEAFSNISVKDIVDDCGLTRQAFYYHFKDKYDLMNWIYYTETAYIMTSNDAAELWSDSLKNLCCYMQRNKTFYTNALKTTGQNSFPEHLYQYIRDLALSALEQMGVEEYEPEKREFIVSFFAIAFVASIVRWSNNGMKEDAADFVDKMRSLFDGSIHNELENQRQKRIIQHPMEITVRNFCLN